MSPAPTVASAGCDPRGTAAIALDAPLGVADDAFGRQDDGGDRTLANPALQRDLATMQPDEPARDRQAETGAFDLAVRVAPRAFERAEHPFDRVRRNANAGIRH